MFVVEVELSDESGQVKHLSDVPFRYASELLQERERLVLLRVESKFSGRGMHPHLEEERLTTHR